MSDDLREAVLARQIRRICHFTPSRNLQHIAAGKVGILSTASLEAVERAAYNATDLLRLDHRKTHICCSIEFPNAWYFSQARQQDGLFLDWVVLLIAPHYLWDADTLFSPRNAAAGYGSHIVTGRAGFESLFAPTIAGAGNRIFRRPAAQRGATPTDQQAEVLVRDRIHPEDILAVAVRDNDQALTERARLRANGLDPNAFKFVIAPHFYEKYTLSSIIQRGLEPEEPLFAPVSKQENGNA